MAEVERIARQKGIECLVVPSSITAEPFYSKLGFKSVRDSYYGDERTIIMERSLTPSQIGPFIMESGATFSIRPYGPADLDAVIDIFLRAIREIAVKDYSQARIDAWAQVNRDGFSKRQLSRPTWIAYVDQNSAGFTDLEPDGHLDMMYVHPAYQKLGVAKALLATVENAACRQALSRIFTEASITARPFFERNGFRIIAAQTVEKRGQTLKNFRMEKLIT
jgi:putative acetyltransferase